MIEHLEDEVRDELESSSHGQTRAVAVMHVNGERLEVLGRIGPGGAIRLGYSYCGVRMERKTLLTLVCPEQSCPCRAASLAKLASASKSPHPRRATFAPSHLESSGKPLEAPARPSNRPAQHGPIPMQDGLELVRGGVLHPQRPSGNGAVTYWRLSSERSSADTSMSSAYASRTMLCSDRLRSPRSTELT